MIYFHTIPPVYDEHSRVLILGSFPSVKSREGMFFYHHPQNRFWRVLSSILEADPPESIEEKKFLLLKNRIALWDVIESCEIEGSDDGSIRGASPNDLRKITHNADIRCVFTNGGTAHRLYLKYGIKQTGIPDTLLPSTSPANAKYNLDRLTAEWSVITEALRASI